MKLRRIRLEHSRETVRAHTRKDCRTEVCPIHKRTEHSMRGFPQHWREDRPLMERICPHGGGHPDPDHLANLSLDQREFEAAHGCDGCCA